MTALALPPDLAPTLREKVEQLIAECGTTSHPAGVDDDPRPGRRVRARRRSHHSRGRLARIRP